MTMSEPAARFGIENLPATPVVGSAETDLEQARLEAQLAAKMRVDLMCRQAATFLQGADYRQAIPRYNQALAEAEKIAHREATVMVLKGLAHCYYHLGHMEVAHRYMEMAEGMSVFTRREEVFYDSIKRKLWDREGRRRRREGF